MIAVEQWVQQASFPARPWLLLGPGPAFDRRGECDLDGSLRLGLDHVVRELAVDVAHVLDVAVLPACAAALPHNARWLVLPRFPLVDGRIDPTRPLESWFAAHPVLGDFAGRGRLVVYDLRARDCPVIGSGPLIRARWSAAAAALQLLARHGARAVRTLGVDDGDALAPGFADVRAAATTAAAPAGRQRRELHRIAADLGLDLAPALPPMRIFVGGDETELVAARVLEHSIRRHASGPVEVTIMRDCAIPAPRDPANHARTKFSFYRFKIPELCGYRGRALYVDSDMLVFRDVAELWRIPFGRRRVLCTRQETPPAAWRDLSWFRPGRQFSVMLLDCDRLSWRVDEIVRGLDEGRYRYQDLLFELCIVPPDEIGDDLPTEWNHLETHVPGRTALTHFTVVPTQPWKTDDSPLNPLWMAAYEQAVATGEVDALEVRRGIARGCYKPSLAEALAQAPAPWAWADVDGPDELQRTEHEIARLEAELAALRGSWTWRLGRLLARPLELLGAGRQRGR